MRTLEGTDRGNILDSLLVVLGIFKVGMLLGKKLSGKKLSGNNTTTNNFDFQKVTYSSVRH